MFCIRKTLLISFLCLIVFSLSEAQVLGDYQSKASGNWSQTGTWEVYTVTGWTAALSAPGTTANVTVYDDDDVVVDGNYTCASLTVNAPGSNATTSLTIGTGNTLTVSGNVTVTGGNNNNRMANIILAGTGILDINGNLTINGNGNVVRAGLNMGSGNSTLKLAGSFTNSGTVTVSGGGANSFEFKSNLAQTIPAGDYYNLTSSGTGLRTLASSGTIKISGTLSSGVNAYTTTGSTIEFNGTGTQTFSGNLGTLLYPFNNLTISNSGSGVQLTSATYLSNILTISGKLFLNRQTLTVSNSSTGAIVRTSGYIVSEDNSLDASGKANNSSKVAWVIGGTTGQHIIPFGKISGSYIPLTVDLTAGNIGTVSVGTYPTTTSSITPYPAAVSHIEDLTGGDNSSYVVGRFWQIDKTGLSGTADITFTFATGEEPADLTGGATNGIRAQRWNGLGWDVAIAGQTNPSSYSVKVPGITQFSPWALAKGISPLPVDLLYFKADLINNTDKIVGLSWATAVESNNESFSVEKSFDGSTFKEIAKIGGNGTKTSLSEYSLEDILTAGFPVVYYRLKQKDFNGTERIIGLTEVKGVLSEVFSDIKARKTGDGQLSFSFNSQGPEQSYSLKIFNLLGKEIYSSSGKTLQGENSLLIKNDELSCGMLIIKLESPAQCISLKTIN